MQTSLSLKSTREQYLVSQTKLTSRARLNHLARPSKTRSLLRQQHHQHGATGSSAPLVASDKEALADEVRLGREGLDRSETEDGSVEEEGHAPRAKVIEVSLVDLVRVKKSRHPSGDFEIIPRFKNVLALDDTEFEPVGHGGGETGSSDDSNTEDDWELVGEDEMGVKAVKKPTKSWAAIVSNKA